MPRPLPPLALNSMPRPLPPLALSALSCLLLTLPIRTAPLGHMTGRGVVRIGENVSLTPPTERDISGAAATHTRSHTHSHTHAHTLSGSRRGRADKETYGYDSVLGFHTHTFVFRREDGRGPGRRGETACYCTTIWDLCESCSLARR